ncbi:hypothetical protein WR25_17654 [Diploscapter pachys]|uniref:C2H2-type domain-containing protein n=1 Tax=Diploscapter pachys TaxID=2018661 RepID=A0A2A2KWB0_9BILA|nr:hypothetical protein WR25_17654 [Diploscapter pachys]
MSSTATVDTSSALSPTEALRRSKRNKFHLDVAAIHSSHPERKRNATGSLTPVESDSHDENADAETPTAAAGGSSKRQRRTVPNRDASYIYDDEDDEYDLGKSGLLGTHFCSKCPARFETKPGLANHLKLHQGERRKNACDLCDFSSGTVKALRQHKRVHERFGVAPMTGTSSSSSSSSASVLSASSSIDLGCSSSANGSATVQQTPSSSKPSTATPSPGAANTPPALSPVVGKKETASRSHARSDSSSVSPKSNKLSTPARIRNNKKKRKKCPDCPFAARSMKRMENHLQGHERTNGYKCTYCSFKSISAGFLQRHINLHENGSAVDKKDSRSRTGRVRTGKNAKAGKSRKVSVPVNRWAKYKPKWKKFQSPTIALPKLFEQKIKNSKQCPEKDCNFVCASLSVLTNHKIRQHMAKHAVTRLWCRLCGRTCKDRTALFLHKKWKHSWKDRKPHKMHVPFMLLEAVGRDYMKAYFGNCLNSLLTPPTSPPPFADPNFVPIPSHTSAQPKKSRSSPPIQFSVSGTPTLVKDEIKTELSSRSATPAPVVQSVQMQPPPIPASVSAPCPVSVSTPLPSTPQPATIPSTPPACATSIPSTSSSAANSGNKDDEEAGDYKCGMCPYTTINNSRLDRHLIKHAVKSNFQCPHCSFSCRGEDLIHQHIRLHVNDQQQKQMQMQAQMQQCPQPVTTSVLVPASPFILSQSPTTCQTFSLPPTTSAMLSSPYAISHLVAQTPTMGGNTSVAQALQSVAKSMRVALQAAAAVNLPPPPPPPTTSADLDYLNQFGIGHNKSPVPAQTANGQIHNGTKEEEYIEVDVKKELYTGYFPKLKKKWFINMKKDIAPSDMKKIKRCPECPYFTKYPCDLRTHLEMHTTKQQSQFKCTLCTYTTKRSMSLRGHILMHNEENIDAAQFRVRRIRLANGKTIGLKKGAGLNRHYACLQCPYVSRYITALWLHFRHHDSTVKWIYTCSSCGYGSNSMTNVEEHHVYHPESASFTKTLNGMAFGADAARKELKVAIPFDKASSHSNSGEGTPRQTDETQWNLLVADELDDSSTLYKCKECPFAHKSYQRVWTHQQKHRKPNRFMCDKCSYNTGTESSLSEHLIVHSQIYAKRYENRHFLYIGRNIKTSGVNLAAGGVHTVGSELARSTHSSTAPSPSSTPLPPILNSASCSNLTFLAASMSSTPPPSASTPKGDKKDINNGNAPPVLDSQLKTDSPENQPHDLLFSPLPPVLVKEEDTLPIDAKEQFETSQRHNLNNGIVTPSMVMDSLVKMGNLLKIDISRTIEVLANDDNTTIRKLIEKEKNAQNTHQCPDCPFSDPDSVVFQLHRDLHGGKSRAFACNICDYSCYSADALYRHISLHIPPQSPNSSAKKRLLGKRRFQQSEPIPNGAKHFACNSCSFKTMSEANYAKHRIDHAQQMQIRLVSQIKRAAIQEESGKAKVKRPAKKSDRDHTCRKCSFRCETFVAFVKHSEMHGMKDTKSIVDFHEQNHHLDVSLTTLKKNAILAPENVKVPVEVTPEERVRLAGGQEFRCKRCKFITYDVVSFARHWAELHLDNEADRQFLREIKMDIVSVDAITQNT